MLERMWREGYPPALLVGMEISRATIGTIWKFLKKLIVELPCDPAIPLLGIYPGKKRAWKDTCTSVLIAALYTITETWKKPRCPLTGEWIKRWYMYTIEHSSVIKKSEIRPFAATWIDLESVILSEVSHREKEKYYTTSLICGI